MCTNTHTALPAKVVRAYAAGRPMRIRVQVRPIKPIGDSRCFQLVLWRTSTEQGAARYLSTAGMPFLMQSHGQLQAIVDRLIALWQLRLEDAVAAHVVVTACWRCDCGGDQVQMLWDSKADDWQELVYACLMALEKI